MTSTSQCRTVSRRDFGVGLLAATAAASLAGKLSAAEAPRRNYKICAFVKFLQELDYEQLADAMADAGFDGVEVTVREKEGYIHPVAAADELPKLLESLKKRNLGITILTTEILNADQPHARRMLEAAASLSIPRYRLGFYRYDLQQPIPAQLAKLQPQIGNLAALNRELGIAGIYQNHCGADYLGATLWDLHSLIKDLRPSEMGCVFDIRHASVEGGEAWPLYLKLMQPHITAVSIKDYIWKDRKSQHVPLGEGRVDPKFFEAIQVTDFDGPISLHVEYLPEAGTAENLRALKSDLATLKRMLAT